MVQGLLQPWHDAVEDPATAQGQVLDRFLKIYARTEYGEQHGASHVDSITAYRRAFPIDVGFLKAREIKGKTNKDEKI